MAEAFDPGARPEFLAFTRRSRQLQHLHDVFEGRQYDGRPDWWDGKKNGRGAPAPLRKRKPCTIYRLPQAATKQVVRFLYGDGRFPKISVERPDDTDDGGVAISKGNAELLEAWFSDLIEAARIKPVERQRATRCISLGTAVTIVALRDGKFTFEHPLPQNCWAQFRNDDPDDAVTRLVWCYAFDKEVADKDGRPECVRYMFRREWDDQNVYVYEDAEVPSGIQYENVEWGTPSEQPHGLSFCPVIWTRNEPDAADGIDGRSLFDDSEEELEALDLTLSRRHQGLIYLGAPQMVETGVKEDDGPEGDGDRGAMSGGASSGVGYKSHGNDYDVTVAEKRRRTGPDTVWSYYGEKVTVELVETTGKAFEVATLHVNDLRSRLLETWGVVLTSMSDTISKVTTGAEMSAKFLMLAHAPLIGLVQEYRHNYWSNSLEPLLTMCLRICAEKQSDESYLLIPNSDKVAKIVQPMLAVNVGGSAQWQPPRLTPKWGQFFEQSSQEINQRTEAATKANDGKLITGKTATEFVAHDFGIDNVEEERDKIEDERSQAEASEAEREEREIKRLEQRAMSSGGVGTGGARRSGTPGDAKGAGKGGSDSSGDASDEGTPAAGGES